MGADVCECKGHKKGGGERAFENGGGRELWTLKRKGKPLAGDRSFSLQIFQTNRNQKQGLVRRPGGEKKEKKNIGGLSNERRARWENLGSLG